jgi:O-antigen ligase
MPQWRTPLTLPWTVWLGILTAASIAAPAFRANALHLTGRMAGALGIFLLTLNGVTTRRRLIASVALMVVVSLVVSVLVVLEYQRIPAVIEGLKAFRPFMTMVGAQVRAGGPLQYPTIASMYLEIVFAAGAGLMLATADARRSRATALLFGALLLAGCAITLTFTRSGLISLAIVLGVLFVDRYRRRGAETGGFLLVGLAIGTAVLFVGSRPFQSVRLRLTSEGQNSWYRAAVVAPDEVRLAAGATVSVPVTLTNTGRVSWDSHADTPMFLSYHWMAADQDRYVVFDGVRTPFPAIVPPGDTIAMNGRLRAPANPGAYRLVWDVVLEHRLWFGNEPGAARIVSRAVVDGVASQPAIPATAPPVRPQRVRPGRFVLWSAVGQMLRAHPALGIGPDNFRLSYADYAKLPASDPRMHSNNMYLELLAGSGLIGGLVFVWLIAAIARLGIRAVRAAPPTARSLAIGIGAALIAIAVHGLVDSFLSFAPMYVLFAITLGLAAACARGLESEGDAHRV